MLDLNKLAGQIPGISTHLTEVAAASRIRLERAQEFLEEAYQQQAELVQKQEQWQHRICFSAAVPIEPLDTRIYVQTPPAQHTVIATDGSQMAPNHHEIAYCYLINMGLVMLHYGQSLHPVLDSVPEVFYKSEDLYVSREWGIKTEEWMGYRRTVSEVLLLAEAATTWANTANVKLPIFDSAENATPSTTNERSNNPKSNIQNLKSPVPMLAMTDGPLIYWFLDKLPSDARDRILPPILEAWDTMRDSKIPLMGYVSASRSFEALNFLRLQACPHDVPDCTTHCNGESEKAPCHVFDPLRDTSVWASQLQPGQRGPLWRSELRILDWYEQHRIYFCYVHVGSEIARIEVPGWVAEDEEMFEEALGLMLGQVQKGYGYPVALAEAHNQAVVRGGDRARFFALLEQQMIKAGLRNVGTSYKETRKRGSIA